MSRSVQAAMLIAAGVVLTALCGNGAVTAVRGHAWLEVAGLAPGVGLGLWGVLDGVRLLRRTGTSNDSQRL